MSSTVRISADFELLPRPRAEARSPVRVVTAPKAEQRRARPVMTEIETFMSKQNYSEGTWMCRHLLKVWQWMWCGAVVGRGDGLLVA